MALRLRHYLHHIEPTLPSPATTTVKKLLIGEKNEKIGKITVTKRPSPGRRAQASETGGVVRRRRCGVGFLSLHRSDALPRSLIHIVPCLEEEVGVVEERKRERVRVRSGAERPRGGRRLLFLLKNGNND